MAAAPINQLHHYSYKRSAQLRGKSDREGSSCRMVAINIISSTVLV